MKIIQKPDMRICCKRCRSIFEFEKSDVRYDNSNFVSCPICNATNRIWNEVNDNEEANRIRLLQYENLRKYFRQLIKDVLGDDYYNMGMDVYECDRICCEDISRKIKGKLK